jgi:hypothetical protein
VVAVAGKIKAPELVAILLEVIVLEDEVTSLLKAELLSFETDAILEVNEETVGRERLRVGVV